MDKDYITQKVEISQLSRSEVREMLKHVYGPFVTSDWKCYMFTYTDLEIVLWTQLTTQGMEA